MKLIATALVMTLISTCANAEVIAAKKLTMDSKTSAIVMLTDRSFPLRCNGHKGAAMIGSVIVGVKGVPAPVQTFNACYYRSKPGEITFQFWDGGSGAMSTLDMEEGSFERTPHFKTWDILPVSVSPAQ